MNSDDTDYSKCKSIADEPHWNDFVQSVGGELVHPLIKRQGVKNADYLFPANKVVAELKSSRLSSPTPQNQWRESETQSREIQVSTRTIR